MTRCEQLKRIDYYVTFNSKINVSVGLQVLLIRSVDKAIYFKET